MDSKIICEIEKHIAEKVPSLSVGPFARRTCSFGMMHRSVHICHIEYGIMNYEKMKESFSNIKYYSENIYKADGTKDLKEYYLYRSSIGVSWKVILLNGKVYCIDQFHYIPTSDSCSCKGGGAGAGAEAHTD